MSFDKERHSQSKGNFSKKDNYLMENCTRKATRWQRKVQRLKYIQQWSTTWQDTFSLTSWKRRPIKWSIDTERNKYLKTHLEMHLERSFTFDWSITTTSNSFRLWTNKQQIVAVRRCTLMLSFVAYLPGEVAKYRPLSMIFHSENTSWLHLVYKCTHRKADVHTYGAYTSLFTIGTQTT